MVNRTSFKSLISISNTGLPTILQRSSASLVHHRNRRTMFICCVIVLMSAVSAIGLQLCPMATDDKCSNESVTTENVFELNSLPVLQLSLDDKQADQVNVYVSATIHHNNITINSDGAINIDAKSVNNFTATSSGQQSLWQKIFPIHFEFYRSLINESVVDAEQAEQASSDIEEELPKNDFLNAETKINYTDNLRAGGGYSDPCSHPEYIVFTWVSYFISISLQTFL